MSCWAILGINPTKNIDVIKDAYNELSNSTNANELIKLKSAYNKALSLAKTSINDLNLSLLGSSNFDILSALINSSIDSKSIDTIDKFIDEANEIYNNPVLRFNIDSWINLLTSPILESSSKELASIELIKFLSNHKYLTTKTYKLFDTKFNWIKNKDKLKSKLSSQLLDSFINHIENPLPLTYKYLNNLDSKKLDEYLELREKAYLSLQENHIEDEKNCLFKAYSIYSKDLDLLKMIGCYYLNKNDNLMALSYFREAININDNDLYSLAKLGHLLTINKQYDKAIIYLEKYLKRLKNSIDLESLIDLAHAYHYSYELQKAKSLYNFLFKLRPWDLSIKLALENINSKLLTDLSPKPLIPATYQKYINSFLKPLNLKLHEIYNNFSFRLQEDKWNELFSLPIASNESLFYLFEETIITFITTNKNMPKNIYEFLSKNFNWNLRNNELLSIYPNLKIDILFNKLYSNESLSYESLKNIKINNLENYIELRSLAYNSICSNSNNSEKYLNDALKLFNGDFELYKLYGQYYSNNKDYNSAIENYKIALSLKEDDYYSICTLALLLTKVENYKDAIFYLNKSVNTQAGKLLLDNEDFLIKYAISFYYIGNLINAKKYFKKLLLLNPNLKFVNIYLKNINDRLAHKKTPILPISVIEDPDCYTNSLHYTTKGRITNIISKFKQGLILKK